MCLQMQARTDASVAEFVRSQKKCALSVLYGIMIPKAANCTHSSTKMLANGSDRLLSPCLGFQTSKGKRLRSPTPKAQSPNRCRMSRLNRKRNLIEAFLKQPKLLWRDPPWSMQAFKSCVAVPMHVHAFLYQLPPKSSGKQSYHELGGSKLEPPPQKIRSLSRGHLKKVLPAARIQGSSGGPPNLGSKPAATPQTLNLGRLLAFTPERSRFDPKPETQALGSTEPGVLL